MDPAEKPRMKLYITDIRRDILKRPKLPPRIQREPTSAERAQKAQQGRKWDPHRGVLRCLLRERRLAESYLDYSATTYSSKAKHAELYLPRQTYTCCPVGGQFVRKAFHFPVLPKIDNAGGR